ncbi:MAG: endospore germination permease [Alicyclobacillaceae bacterium]|nr:endospore germination permease [Alicyclobacillaceae bacterium]
MAPRGRITEVQATAVLVSTAVGVGMLSLPYFAAEKADTSAPLATFLGALFVLVALWLNTAVGLRFPTMSIIRYGEEVLGKWFGRAANIALSTIFVVLTALGAREFAEILITSMLPRTPVGVVVTLLLLIAAAATRYDLETFAYIHLFYFPVIVIPVGIVVLTALRYGDPLQVMPLWNGDWAGVAKGTLNAAALFQGAFVMTILIPNMRRPRSAWKVGLAGMFLVSVMMVTMVVAAQTVLGTNEVKSFYWPTLVMIRSITLPGEVLERLDVVVAIMWVVAVYTTVYSSYYLSVTAFGEMTQLRDHRLFSFSLLPFIAAVAMMPPDIHHLYRTIARVGYLIDAAAVGYPLLLWSVARIRGKGGTMRRGQEVGRP